MNLLSKVLQSNFIIKLTNWEYWPFEIIQAPVFFYWIWLSFKARSLVFFSASNPGIVMGGMFGESKFEVLEKLPTGVKPKTILISRPFSVGDVIDKIKVEGFCYPFVCKPDLGERGWMVRIVNNEEELREYCLTISTEFLVQELIESQLEFGVFYAHNPVEPSGRVTSIVGKEMLYVVGNGDKSLKTLILEKKRAKLQWKKLKTIYKHQLDDIIPKGEKLQLVSIGNHCLGTKFLNSSDLITQKLSNLFAEISSKIEGFYFGRFDIRVETIEDLENGNFKVMELNGCGAEPAHIYQPGTSIFTGWLILLQHWHLLYKISVWNHRNGAKYIPLKEAYYHFKKFKTTISE